MDLFKHLFEKKEQLTSIVPDSHTKPVEKKLEKKLQTRESVIQICLQHRHREQRLVQCKSLLSEIEPPIKPKEIINFAEKCNLDVWQQLHLSEQYFILPTTPEISFTEYWEIAQNQGRFFTTIYMYECQIPVKIKHVLTWRELWRIVDGNFKNSTVNYLMSIASKIVLEAPTPEMVLEYAKLSDCKKRGIDIIKMLLDKMTNITSAETYEGLRTYLSTGTPQHDIGKIITVINKKLHLSEKKD